MADKIDPVVATGFRITADQSGAVMVFQKPVFTLNEKGDLVPDMVASAAATMSWSLVEDIYKVLGNVIDQRDAAIASAVRAEKSATQKPN